MLWRLQYTTKGRNSFVKMYALDLSPNCNTVKTNIFLYYLISRKTLKKFDILEKYICGDNPIRDEKTNPKPPFVTYCFKVVQFSNLILLRTSCFFTCLKSSINRSFPLPLIDTVKGLTTWGLFDSSFTKPPFNNSTIAVSTKCVCSIED